MTAADDLRTAVAALCQPTKAKVMLDPESVAPGAPTTITATVPSLLDQLEDAAEQGSEGGGGRGVPGSRPPTGLDVLDVRIEISTGIAHRRAVLGMASVDDVAQALTGLAERTIMLVQSVSSPVGEDDVAGLAHRAFRWRRIAEQALRIEYRARELVGLPCPNRRCTEKWVSPAGPAEERQAALFMVVGPTGSPRAMECRACGRVWWAGSVLDEVGAATRRWQAAGELGVKGRTA